MARASRSSVHSRLKSCRLRGSGAITDKWMFVWQNDFLGSMPPRSPPRALERSLLFWYSAAATIVEIAATMGASHLILGAPRGNILVNFIRGNLLRRVSSALPENIQFIVYHH